MSKSWFKPEIAFQAEQSSGERAIFRGLSILLDESRKQVPLDKGALQRSGAVDVSGKAGTVSYDTPYACRWHENDAHFQRGRKKKYLEDPANDSAVLARIREQFGGMF